jgi:hypothetical protein
MSLWQLGEIPRFLSICSVMPDLVPLPSLFLDAPTCCQAN